jgi:hypothetical protein
MRTFKLRRQAERVGLNPTLSVAVAGGVALQMYNQPMCNIDEIYGDYEGNTPIECLFSLVKVFFRQLIIHLPSDPQIGVSHIYYTYYVGGYVNQ